MLIAKGKLDTCHPYRNTGPFCVRQAAILKLNKYFAKDNFPMLKACQLIKNRKKEKNLLEKSDYEKWQQTESGKLK